MDSARRIRDKFQRTSESFRNDLQAINSPKEPKDAQAFSAYGSVTSRQFSDRRLNILQQKKNIEQNFYRQRYLTQLKDKKMQLERLRMSHKMVNDFKDEVEASKKKLIAKE